MAAAKSGPPPAARDFAALPMPLTMRSMGSGTPITPVEATATSSGGRRNASAATRRICAASPSPRLPVQALALPEFTTTPRSRSQNDEPRVRRTGAAAAAFVVNSTADEHGRSERQPRS